MVKKKKVKENPWFRERVKSKEKWSFIPVNWKGFVVLVLLVGVNVFSANYFNLEELVWNNYLKAGVIFLLSMFVFIEIAKLKCEGTRG